jgi:hypothetical protein
MAGMRWTWVPLVFWALSGACASGRNEAKPVAVDRDCHASCMESCMSPSGKNDYGPCVASCDSFCRSNVRPSGALSSTSSTTTSLTAPPTSSASASTTLSILVKCQKTICQVEVVNESDAPVQIVDLLQAEREDESIGGPVDSRWTPAGSALRVKEQCGPEQPKPPCIEIAPKASLHLPTWVGMTCDPRCPCKANALLKPGDYRFVGQVCGTKQRIESAPFAWNP